MGLKEVIATEYQGSVSGSTHLLLAGDTKLGKTDYVAQAAKDGYEVLYFDKDNGLATLATELRGNDAAMARVTYFNPDNFAEFIEQFLTAPVIRYNLRTRAAPAFSDNLDDRILIIYPARIPRGVIMAIDSWTALVLSIMENKAKKENVSLVDIDKYSREIYGGSGFLATQIAGILQKMPFHVVVLAHPGLFERKEKPQNKTTRDITEKDMIVRETTKVVLSTSLPHGATLGKFFNQIGWLEVDRADRRFLDFTTQQGRMGGGTPNAKGDPRAEFRFSKLFGPVPTYPDRSTWMKEVSYEEMKAEAQSSSTLKFGAKSTAQVAAPAAAAAAAAKPNFLNKLKVTIPTPTEVTPNESERDAQGLEAASGIRNETANRASAGDSEAGDKALGPDDSGTPAGGT